MVVRGQGGIEKGHKYGRLTAVRFIGKNKNYMANWEWLCDCGKTIQVYAGDVKCGHTTSCGCYVREMMADKQTTHGLSKTREYKIWAGMIKRCTNANVENYHLYGGRGIKVCEKWASSFEEFHKDMGFAPSKQHSIERIDGDGNYEPGNCKWATSAEQSANRNNNRWVEYKGEQRLLCHVVAEIDTHATTVYYWMDKGLTADEIETVVNSTLKKGFRFYAPSVTHVVLKATDSLAAVMGKDFHVVVNSSHDQHGNVVSKVVHGHVRKINQE
ncbi:HNH endonuclease [Erwinia phage vB_EamM_Deimos-Minion]|uniref:Putative HNH endonuclease n=1 Tax=Erwinia phage vB_EamM_Deimos-Minion TaxID=1815986 RepID=A0A173GFA2_9CAUD|nr:HNH endonuclease [Erwinia phage vB_EamM_Deimos-Minion]ANH52334.1 putative HNH endonuclease [Erwinia phage vB_EamM_Deimos-Minion]